MLTLGWSKIVSEYDQEIPQTQTYLLNGSMFGCMLLYVHSSIAIILMGKGELVALLNLSSWCRMMVEWLFLTMPLGCLRFVFVVFPDHTHLLFLQDSPLCSCGAIETVDHYIC